MAKIGELRPKRKFMQLQDGELGKIDLEALGVRLARG